jgi:uncharacterized membrane protein YhaH (DUF805 family)
MNHRISREGFFAVFALTSFATIPGLSLLSPFVHRAGIDRLVSHPVQFTAGVILFLIPMWIQMVYFVRRMHDQGYETEESILLYSVSMLCFIGPSAAGYPLASALTVIVYFACGFRTGSQKSNRWGPPPIPRGSGLNRGRLSG